MLAPLNPMDKDQQETTEGQQEFRRVFINEDENKEHLYELLGVTSKVSLNCLHFHINNFNINIII